MREFSKYVGLDVHKDSIAVAVAEACRDKPRYYGEIPNTPEAIAKLVNKLGVDGEVVSFCYEAGPCGYGLYRQLTGLGHVCEVVAPSLIPAKPGDRVKTDRRDGESLARLHRAGELTAVWVPEREQEAMRDLTRCREDMKAMERQARQRLNAFLLRHGRYIRARANGRRPIVGGWSGSSLTCHSSRSCWRSMWMRSSRPRPGWRDWSSRCAGRWPIGRLRRWSRR